MPPSSYDLHAIGNPLVDVLSRVSFPFLEEQAAHHGMIRGTMNLVDEGRALSLNALIQPEKQAAGGSAANTLAVFAALGARAAFTGKIGDDALGVEFAKSFHAMGVHTHLAAAPKTHTGRCLILIDDEGQRTMNTFLGAASSLGVGDLNEGMISNSKITYLEGYLFDRDEAQKAFYRAAQICRQAGQKLALTLSDPFCVERHRAAFLDLVHGHVDLLFANEEEIRALYHVSSFDDAVRLVRVQCPLAIITRSEKGSVIITPQDIIEIKAAPVPRVIDTTGAGDCYAAGFLAAYARGNVLQDCGALASAVAAAVIAQIGPRPEGDLKGFWTQNAA